MSVDQYFLDCLKRGEHLDLSDEKLAELRALTNKHKIIPQFSDAPDDLHLSHSDGENGENLWKVLDKNFQELRDNITPAALNDIQVIRDELQAIKDYCDKNGFDISAFRG